jgi:2-oxoglutarate ferredoxin oxidoreductase subunit delta
MTAKRQVKKQKAKVADKRKDKPSKTKTVRAGEKKPEDKKKKFEVEFYLDWCKGCGICAAFCPVEAISLNDRGEPEIADPDRCIGCMWCEIRCPDFAVRVREKEEAEVCEA